MVGAVVATLAVAGLAGVTLWTASRSARAHRAAGPDVLPLASLAVVDTGGRLEPLVPEGGGVVLVVSASCGHCHALLRQLAAIATDRSFTHLQVVTLEGAKAGRRLLDSLGLRAVDAVGGPAGQVGEFLRRTKTRSTPLLLYVGADGTVRDRTAGELSNAEALAWLDRMR
jgi:hypothetical protein